MGRPQKVFTGANHRLHDEKLEKDAHYVNDVQRINYPKGTKIRVSYGARDGKTDSNKNTIIEGFVENNYKNFIRIRVIGVHEDYFHCVNKNDIICGEAKVKEAI